MKPAALPTPAVFAVPATRRMLRSAAAQEEVAADLSLLVWLFAAACCAGAGLAIGLHWDAVIANLRLATFDAEQPRLLWQMVGGL